jgi:hypothetical protein
MSSTCSNRAVTFGQVTDCGSRLEVRCSNGSMHVYSNTCMINSICDGIEKATGKTVAKVVRENVINALRGRCEVTTLMAPWFEDSREYHVVIEQILRDYNVVLDVYMLAASESRSAKGARLVCRGRCIMEDLPDSAKTVSIVWHNAHYQLFEPTASRVVTVSFDEVLAKQLQEELDMASQQCEADREYASTLWELEQRSLEDHFYALKVAREEERQFHLAVC